MTKGMLWNETSSYFSIGGLRKVFVDFVVAATGQPASDVASQPVNPCLLSGKDRTTPATESHAWPRRERGVATRTSMLRRTSAPSQTSHSSASGSLRMTFAVRVDATSRGCG